MAAKGSTTSSPAAEHPHKSFGWAARDSSGVLSPFNFTRTYLPMDKGAPLLCAGITVYSPMKRFELNEPGKHIGVVGLGGLGHVAVKFGKAMGMKVTVISSSPSKEKEAVQCLGADAFLVSSNPEAMQAAMCTMDGIINRVSAVHDLAPLIHLLKAHGKMILLGLPEKPFQLQVFPLVMAGRIVAGSNICGLKDTQEMIDFAGKHNITTDIELVPMDYVNKAIERLSKGDVRYRFVIDVANSLTNAYFYRFILKDPELRQ